MGHNITIRNDIRIVCGKKFQESKNIMNLQRIKQGKLFSISDIIKEFRVGGGGGGWVERLCLAYCKIHNNYQKLLKGSLII